MTDDIRRKLYNAVKAELKSRCSNTSYFTFDFFNVWIQAQKDRDKAFRDGTEQGYEKDGVVLYHFFDPVYKSDFYNKNSVGYCEFLAVVCDYNKSLINL